MLVRPPEPARRRRGSALSADLRSVAAPASGAAEQQRALKASARRRREVPPPAPAAEPEHAPPAAPTSSAEARRRRYRARQRARLIVVPVEIDEASLQLLVDSQLLLERESTDRDAIGAAVTALLRDAAAHR